MNCGERSACADASCRGRRRRAAAPAAPRRRRAGARRTSSAVGTSSTQATMAIASWAVRQS